MDSPVNKILILDDHDIVSGGLKSVLAGQFPGAEIEVAGSLSEAILLCDAQDFDLYLLDIALQDGSGIDLLKKLGATGKQGRKIIFTGSATTLDLVSVQEIGADAIVSKNEPVETIIEAVRQVAGGHPFTSPLISQELEGDPAQVGLTPRMMDVLRLLVEGAGNKEIAYKLEMTETTVSFHLRSLRQRLGAVNNREIIRKARSHGFL